VVSYVSLRSGESPFHKLELVYQAIARGIRPRLTADELGSGYEKGIMSFLKSWVGAKYTDLESKGLSGEQLKEALLAEVEKLAGIESISFERAIRSATGALLDGREEDFANICQWLSGEGYDRRVHAQYGILQRIDRTTALPMIRSLVKWIRGIGYSGLVILLDEAERRASLSTKQREQHLSNLREIIDECGNADFQGVMIFYAVPDESFLEGRTQVYEALKQRLASAFDELNPTGVKIELERLPVEPVEFLRKVGLRLKEIYEAAYNCELDDESAEKTIDLIAKSAYEERFGDIGYKRLFVQRCVRGLHFLRRKGRPPSPEEIRG